MAVDIERINALARKKKEEGLTEDEQEEQNRLRSEYLQAVRNSLKSELERIDIVEKDGSVTPLSELHKDTNN